MAHKQGGCFENCSPLPGLHCHCMFCCEQFICHACAATAMSFALRLAPTLQFRAETGSVLPPHRAWVSLGICFLRWCANTGIDGWSLKSRWEFWRSCSLTSALSSPIQLKVARAVASSRGDLPKSGPSGRANITTSKVATSIHTRSPARPRCSRWGEFSEPKVPLTTAQSWPEELWPSKIRLLAGLGASTSCYVLP